MTISLSLCAAFCADDETPALGVTPEKPTDDPPVVIDDDKAAQAETRIRPTKPAETLDWVDFSNNLEFTLEYEARQKSIKLEELVWHREWPAIVVPQRLHFKLNDACAPKRDEVQSWGGNPPAPADGTDKREGIGWSWC